jgi:hypothetical protein
VVSHVTLGGGRHLLVYCAKTPSVPPAKLQNTKYFILQTARAADARSVTALSGYLSMVTIAGRIILIQWRGPIFDP